MSESYQDEHAIDAYVDEIWEEYIRDVASLISIDSSYDEETADVAAGHPFGKGPREALDCARGIAQKLGFSTRDIDGYAAVAEFPGKSDQTLGIIGHVDVVPAGIGWTYPPFELTRTDGFMIGRGTADDKAPVLAALYALAFWKKRLEQPKHSVQVIFGSNEEMGMGEMPYLREHLKAPDFLFTPDADFPLGYGEKGHFIGVLSSEHVDGAIVELDAGTAENAVPARAYAVVRGQADECPMADRIDVQDSGDGCVSITAYGVAGHAAMPQGTLNAIGILAEYLLANAPLSDAERFILTFAQRAASSTDGSVYCAPRDDEYMMLYGLATADEDFGALTAVTGVLRLEGGVFKESIDVRFPTSVSSDEVARVVKYAGLRAGFSDLETIQLQEPFLMDPHSPAVEALLDAYHDVTGSDKAPFTMGGGTYAREFPHAVSFGAQEEGVFEYPDWIGSEHCANEGMCEEELKRAMKVYIRAIGNVLALDDLRA